MRGPKTEVPSQKPVKFQKVRQPSDKTTFNEWRRHKVVGKLRTATHIPTHPAALLAHLFVQLFGLCDILARQRKQRNKVHDLTTRMLNDDGHSATRPLPRSLTHARSLAMCKKKTYLRRRMAHKLKAINRYLELEARCDRAYKINLTVKQLHVGRFVCTDAHLV